MEFKDKKGKILAMLIDLTLSMKKNTLQLTTIMNCK